MFEITAVRTYNHDLEMTWVHKPPVIARTGLQRLHLAVPAPQSIEGNDSLHCSEPGCLLAWADNLSSHRHNVLGDNWEQRTMEDPLHRSIAEDLSAQTPAHREPDRQEGVDMPEVPEISKGKGFVAKDWITMGI